MELLSGKIKAAHIIKLKTGEDLLGAIEQAVQQNGIQHATFVSAIGSLSSSHVHVVKTTNIPPGNIFMKEDAPFDIVAVTGYVFAGRVHAHITLTDEKRTIGGHLEEGCRVLTFAIITMVELDGIDTTDLDRYRKS